MKKLLIVAALSAAFVSPAWACCGDGKQAAEGAEKAGDAVSKSVASAGDAVVSWIKYMDKTIEKGFARVAGEIQKQTAAMRSIQQGNVAVQSQLYMEKARADAQIRYELSPRACFESASASSAALATGETQRWQQALDSDFASRTLFTPNTTAAVAKAYDGHAENYCSEQDVELGRCARPATLQLQNADVRADATLGVSSYTPAQIAAARAFVNNVVNPVPTQNIPRGWEKTPQGRTFVAGQYIEQARASIAAHSLNSAIVARIPVKGLGDSAMLNRADISPLELMEAQVRGRFESKSWYKMIAGFSNENLLREVNKMYALKLQMDLDQYRQNERIEIILAAQLAIDVKADAERRAREARSSAMKAEQ